MKWIIITIALLWSGVALSGENQTLIGGTEAQPGEFPEVVYIKHQIETGRWARCTSTIIGPRVILTAAHCVKDNGEISPAGFHNETALEFQVGQKVFKAQCKQAPLYRDNKEDHDVALCVTDRKMDVKYASVAKDGPALDDFVQLIGYGCTQQGGGGGNDGILRWGEAKVVQLPSDQNNWFYTRWKTALCFGDSGGPSMKKLDSPRTDHHWVIGVNSRGNIRDLSLMTAMWLDKTKQFLGDFTRSTDTKICGFNLDCADTKPDPDPDPNEPDCEVEKSMVRYYQGRLVEWEYLLRQCLQGNNYSILPFIE